MQVPTFQIQLDRERPISFPLPALFAIEEQTGISLDEMFSGEDERRTAAFQKLFDGDSTREGMQNVITLLAIGLNDPEMTREKLLGMIPFGEFNAIKEKLCEAFLGSVRKSEPSPDPTQASQPGA
jgi:hypothetical protein